MFCEKCGKEISDSSSFCEFCGTQIGADVNDEKDKYLWGQTIDKETQAILREKKKNRTIKYVNNMGRLSSVMWLISGILQIIIGIKCVSDLILYSPNSVYDLVIPSYVSYFFLTMAMFFMGYINIMIFCESKNKCVIWNREKISFPVAVLAVYIIMFIVMFTISINSYYVNGIEFIIFVAAAIASVADIIKKAVVKSKKDIFCSPNTKAPKKNKIIFVIMSCFVGIIMLISSVFITIDCVVDIKLDTEKEKAISTLKAGHLVDYPNKTVMDVIEYLEYSEGFNFYDFWDYVGDKKRSFVDILFGKESETSFISTNLTNYANIDANKTYIIDLKFKVNNHGLISIEKITKNNDDVLLNEKKAEWIDDYFGNGILEKRGKKYVKNGMYISDTQTLYSAPSFGSTTTYTYNRSGTKTILDYEISKDGKTLWLKLSGSSDGKYSNFYVPEKY